MNWKEDPRWAYVFVNLSCLMWASNFVLGRTLREEIGPLMLTTSRVAVVSLFYAVILGRTAIKERLLSRDWVLLTAMALTGILGFPFLLYRGLQLTTATDAVLINATGPLMTAVLAAHSFVKRSVVPPALFRRPHILFRRGADRQRRLI
jgi:drug/metabolite transporter (DMT)-like permease